MRVIVLSAMELFACRKCLHDRLIVRNILQSLDLIMCMTWYKT
jgi:hypothetical protein